MSWKITNTYKNKLLDQFFKILTALCALITFLLMVGIFVELFLKAYPSIKHFGIRFLTSTTWDPVNQQFSAVSSIFGTLVSTLISVTIAIPMSIVIALFLVELAPERISRIAGYGLELLAAIPSIIYGMWGLFVFAPFMSVYIQPFLKKCFGFLPLFSGPPMGIGMLTAGIILSLMILPFICSVMRDIFQMVPSVLKESAYALGSTTWEVTYKVSIRYGFRGLLGACFLGLGRAIGETMAVTFVIGNTHKISASLFSPGTSIASTLANEFTEASEPLYLSSLIYLGLILFIITFIIQVLAQLWLRILKK